jgi:hypothetical protein
MIDFGRSTFFASLGFAKLGFDAAGKATAAQMELARNTFEKSADLVKRAATVRDPQDVQRVATQLANAASDAASAYIETVREAFEGAQAQTTEFLATRLYEWNEFVTNATAEIATRAPMASDWMDNLAKASNWAASGVAEKLNLTPVVAEAAPVAAPKAATRRAPAKKAPVAASRTRRK